MRFNKGISVIVPVYNAEKYLPDCIDSLFTQTFRKNLEYIFVLDINSTDSSEEILENAVIKMPNAKVLKPKDGSGAGYNRNIALKYASKDYIGFFDSDDWSDSDFYERLYDYAQIYDADIAIGGILLINDTDKSIFNKSEFPFSIEYTPGKVFLKLKWNTAWDKIYRTKLILGNKEIRFAEGIIHEDNIFVINAVCKANKVITVPGSYYWWRRYPESVCSIPVDSEKYIKEAVIAFNQILDSLEKMELPQPDKAIIINQLMPWVKQAFLAGKEHQINFENRIKGIIGDLPSGL